MEVVGGDLTNPPSLEPSRNGVERMYLFPVGRTAREVVAAAKRAGVRRIVVLSGALADTDDSEDGYLAVERAVEDSGLEWTHVRSGEFAANWLDWAPAIKEGRVVRRPYGAAVTQPTHEADIAAVAATVLVEDGHAGRTYTFAGPEALTTVAQVTAIGTAIGATVRFEELDPAEAQSEWISNGYPETFVDWIFTMWAESGRDPAPTNQEWADVVPRLTGRPRGHSRNGPPTTRPTFGRPFAVGAWRPAPGHHVPTTVNPTRRATNAPHEHLQLGMSVGTVVCCL